MSEMKRKELAVRTRTLAEARQVEFVASTPELDRESDRVLSTAWQLDNFRRNPTLLWAHDYKQPPLGKVVDVAVRGDALVARAQFAAAGVSANADAVYELIRMGALNAVSVGFRPITWTENGEGGVDFTAVELLEISVVPVPANPQALITGKQAGGARDLGVSREQVRQAVHEVVRAAVRYEVAKHDTREFCDLTEIRRRP